jgi:hypothetical protein
MVQLRQKWRERGAGPGGTGFPRLWGAAARGMATQGSLCGGPCSSADLSQRTIVQCCLPGHTAAAEGEETGWRFFIDANIKSGLSPLSLAPCPDADRKQINL